MSKKSPYVYVEKYRPQTIDECILPATTKKIFKDFVNSGDVPSLLLSGSAGTGKTTVAKAMARELSADVLVINASKERGIDVIRTKMTDFITTVSLDDSSSSRKIIIWDEADGLTSDAQSAIRAASEEFSDYCTFIFTCNFKNKLIDPILSRCVNIDFTFNKSESPQLMAKFMKRVQHILDAESVQYDNKVVAKLISTYYPDFRRTLNELQAYAVGGVIDTGIFANIKELKLSELVDLLKAKKFTKMREWVGINSDILDSQDFFRKIYDTAYDYLEPSSIPDIVVLLGEYQYKASMVADQEINIAAFLTEVMGTCEFK